MTTAFADEAHTHPTRRTHQPVRRKSHLAGKQHNTFWKPTNRREVRKIVLAARKFDLAHRHAGERNGPLGHIAIEILELFANLVSFKTGQLDPSLDFLCAKLHRSKDAVHRALKALRDYGFIDWLRRYVPVDNPGRGPQVRQTSNAYRMMLPLRAMQWLGAWGQRTPLPLDAEDASAAREAAVRAAEASLSPVEAVRHHYAQSEDADNPLAALWMEIAKRRELNKERESVEQAESRSKI